MSDLIYLDHNATTPLDPSVFESMVPYLKNKFGNPSSAHPVGWEAKGAVEDAREQVANLIGCRSSEIFFTSGGTESNNLAILGLADKTNNPGHIVTSTVEHPATTAPLAKLEQSGWSIDRVEVDKDCVVNLDKVLDQISTNTSLVTIMHSNNETGALQPIEQIALKARALGVPVHSDAAQSVGKVPINVRELGLDMLSIAGHKLYAPKGVGVLYLREGITIHPFMIGAGQERSLRPGTENVAGIVAMGTACEIANKSLFEEMARIGKLCNILWSSLSTAIPNLKLNGPINDRLPGTLNVRFPDISGAKILAKCYGIAASTGAACHEGGKETPSDILTAMGIDTKEALGSIRLSLGRSTTSTQIEHGAEELISVYKKLRASL